MVEETEVAGALEDDTLGDSTVLGSFDRDEETTFETIDVLLFDEHLVV